MGNSEKRGSPLLGNPSNTVKEVFNVFEVYKKSTCVPKSLNAASTWVNYMNVTIKNINRKLYQEFKAEAARRGLEVGEALTLAIQEFMKSERTNKNLSILEFEPFDWGEGTETVSEDVDAILYGD